MKSGRNLILLAGSGVLVVVLAAVVWVEWRQGQTRLQAIAEPTEQTGDAGGAVDLPRLTSRGGGLERYSEIVARPLFSRSRRPVAADTAKVKVERPSEIDKLVLTGIVSGPDTRVAMLVNTQNKKEVRLVEGQSYNGWKLKSFSEGGVTFSYRGRTRELPLLKKKAQPKAGRKRALPPALRRNPYLSRSKRMQIRNNGGAVE